MTNNNNQHKEDEAKNFLLYNEAISMLKMTSMAGATAPPEMISGSVFQSLAKIYSNKTVYNSVLQYIYDNGMYNETYARAIFQLQFSQESRPGEDNGNGGQGQSNSSSEEGSGGIAQKSKDSTVIPKDFISKYFKTDGE